jgi:hypothetical protein
VPRQHHRRESPGNLSARSIQLGTAVAPSLPQELHRIRGPKDGTAASSGQSSMLTALVTAVLAGHEQATDAMPAHGAKRHGADGSSSLAMPTSSDRERNQGGQIGSRKGTNVALSD